MGWGLLHDLFAERRVDTILYPHAYQHCLSIVCSSWFAKRVVTKPDEPVFIR